MKELDIQDLKKLATENNHQKEKVFFEKEIKDKSLLNHLKGAAKEHVRRIQSWSYEQYFRYLHECFIDRNLDVNKSEKDKRVRTPVVFNSKEGVGVLRSSSYMNEVEICYGSLFNDFFKRGRSLITEPEEIISLWSDNFAREVPLTDKPVKGGYSHYSCLAENTSDEMWLQTKENLLQAVLQIKQDDGFFENNFFYRDVYHLKDQNDPLFYALFRNYHNQPINTALENSEPEIKKLVSWFETKIKKTTDQLSRAKTILDFTALFELHHFFPDGNGRMEIMLEHYLFLREGMAPLLTYNACCFPIDWLLLKEEGKNLIVLEASIAMEELMSGIEKQKPFDPSWKLVGERGEEKLTDSNMYQRYLKPRTTPRFPSIITSPAALNLEELHQIAQHAQGRVRFETGIRPILKQLSVKGEAKKHLDLMANWSYEQYVRFLYEIAIDRNLDLNGQLKDYERRVRKADVFSVDEDNQGSQTRAYMAQIENCYSSLLIDYLKKEPDELLGLNQPNPSGAEAVQLWSDHFAGAELSYLQQLEAGVSYGYSCIPVDLCEEMSLLLLQYVRKIKEKNSTLFKHNYPYVDFFKDKADLSFRCHLYRTFGSKQGGQLKTLNETLDEAIPEISQLLSSFNLKCQGSNQAIHLKRNILDFTGHFEMSHFFVDANGRMRWLLEHYLFLRLGFSPLLPYNTGYFAIDWFLLNDEGKEIILKESSQSMTRLIDAINRKIPFNPEWSLPGNEDLRNPVVYRRLLR